MLCREVSYSSSSLLLVVSIRSRLLVPSSSALTERGLRKVGVPANNNSTYYSSKANVSLSSSLAVLYLVYLLSQLSSGLGRE